MKTKPSIHRLTIHGVRQIVEPASNIGFSLLELQHLVGGRIEMIEINGATLCCNEDAIGLRLPINPIATAYQNEARQSPKGYVLGDVLFGDLSDNNLEKPSHPMPGLYYQTHSYCVRLIEHIAKTWLAALIAPVGGKCNPFGTVLLPGDLAGHQLIEDIDLVASLNQCMLPPPGTPGVQYLTDLLFKI